MEGALSPGALAPGEWEPATHALGRGLVRAENVVLYEGAAALTLSVGSFDGAEIRSVDRVGYGVYAARMKTPRAPGTLSAFFLYEGGSDIADELDIEIFNDGSRRVLFTTWVAGETTHTTTLTLPFDPAAGFHEYGIVWSAREVSFVVDGAVMQRWNTGIPRNPMFVMANVWWPTWISGSLLHEPRSLLIDWIGPQA